MVERVEGVDTQLETSPLGESEGLGETHIPVVYAWARQEIARCRAVNAGRRIYEARSVEPFVYGLGESSIGITHLIGALKESVEEPVRIGRSNGIRKAGLEGSHTRKLPTTDKSVGGLVHSAEQPLAASDGQLVDVAGYKTMLYTEVGRAVISIGIMIVHESLPSRPCGSAHTG